MGKYLYIFLSILLYSFVSCSNHGSTSASLDNYFLDSDTIQKISFSDMPKHSILSYSDIYDTVMMVKLETVEQSIIGWVSKVVLLPNENILVFDSNSKKVLMFDKNGKFLNRIGQYGKGNKEYQDPLDVVYDKYTDEVVVWDHPTKTFRFYKTNGEYLRGVTIPWWFGTFSVLDKDHFVLYMNFWEAPVDNIGYNVKIITKNGELVNQGMQYNGDAISLFSICSSALTSYNSTIYCNPYYSSIVFDVKKEGVFPHYVFDFGKNAIPHDWFGFFENREFMNKVSNNPDLCFCSFFAETSNGYAANIIQDGVVHLCTKSKNEDSVMKYARSLHNDMFGGVSETFINAVQGDKLISVIYSERFESYRHFVEEFPNPEERRNQYIIGMKDASKMGMTDEEIRVYRDFYQFANMGISSESLEFINSFDGSENPVIQIATLKK